MKYNKMKKKLKLNSSKVKREKKMNLTKVKAKIRKRKIYAHKFCSNSHISLIVICIFILKRNNKKIVIY